MDVTKMTHKMLTMSTEHAVRLWGCEAVILATPENRTVGWRSVEAKMWSLARRWPQRIGHVVTIEDVCTVASYISDSVWQAQLYTNRLWSTEIILNSNYIFHIWIAENWKFGTTLVQKQRTMETALSQCKLRMIVTFTL